MKYGLGSFPKLLNEEIVNIIDRIFTITILFFLIGLSNVFAEGSIGDIYQCGKVAFVLQPVDFGYVSVPTKGLIAAPSDQNSGNSGISGQSKDPGEISGK